MNYCLYIMKMYINYIIKCGIKANGKNNGKKLFIKL